MKWKQATKGKRADFNNEKKTYTGQSAIKVPATKTFN